MTTKAETEKTEAIEHLRKWLKPGDTVYTILRHVSRSGMQRQISVVVLVKDEDGSIIDLHPNWSVAKATGYRLNKGGANDALIVDGAGMDMGFDVVYNLGRVLFPDVTTDGHKDGGYSLKHRWL